MSTIHQKRVMRKRSRRARVHHRVRNRVRGTAERPRLAVFKSLRYVYAQIIDDETGATLVAASSLEGTLRPSEGSPGSRAAATVVGEAIASRALEKGVKEVVFDRGGNIYHGKIAALATSARDKGLRF